MAVVLIGCLLLGVGTITINRIFYVSLADELPAIGAESAYSLSITQVNGTVTVSPQKDTYAENEEVTLTATGAQGFVFSRWGGSLRSAANPITIKIGVNTDLPAGGVVAIDAVFVAGSMNPSAYAIESVTSIANDPGKAIFPPASGTVPAKGVPFVQEETGNTVTRLTDLHTDFPSLTTDHYHGYTNGYSTYTYENVNGEYMIMQNTAADGATAGLYLYNLATNTKVKRLDATCKVVSDHRLDEANDVRWDLSGRPGTEYTIYYQENVGRGTVCKQDVLTGVATQVYNFTTNGTVPAEFTATFGDDHMSQSRNATYRAVRARNDATSKWIAGVVDLRTGTMLPGLVEVSDYHNDGRYIPANYAGIDISPEGTWLAVGGWSDLLFNSCLNTADPLPPSPLRFYRISDLANGITDQYVELPTKRYGHSSWTHDALGNEVFVHQNDCTDSYAGFNPVSQDETSYIRMPEMNGFQCVGFHLQRNDNPLLNGWLLMSSYSGAQGSNWAHNQIFMVEMKPEAQHPRIWRIASNYSNPWPVCSSYDSNHYFAQGFASINYAGTRIYWGSNWNDTSNLETYKVDLPQDWHEVLSPSGPIATLSFSIRLTGRAASGSDLDSADHSDSLAFELMDAGGLSFSPPRIFSSNSTSGGLVSLSTSTTPILRELQNNPGTNYTLRVRPKGYVPSSLVISDASFVTPPAVTAYYPGAFAGTGDRVALSDFATLASYYNGGQGSPGVVAAYGSRPQGSLLAEFASLAYRYNEK